MAINERHEQLNRNIGKEGTVGLTEDNNKFHRWLLCTQEVTRVIAEFEAQTVLKNNQHHQDFQHHEDSKTFHHNFRDMLMILKKSLNNLETHSVTEDCSDLI